MSNDLSTQLVFAETLAKSGMLPTHMRGNPANVLWACEFAKSLGLQPIQAITSVYVVDGKPTASAALISALVRKAGHRLRVSGDGVRAVASIWRRDDPEFEFRSEWTIERAQTAGLCGKGPWRAYPAAMLQARAITEVARQACQDAILGLQYTPEELGADVDDEGAIVVHAPPAPRQAPQPAATGKAAALTAAVAPAPTAPPPQALPAPAQEAVGWRDEKDRKWFCAELRERFGLDYDDVAAWRESDGRSRPSAMTPTQRRELLVWLADMTSKPAKSLQAWLTARHEAQSAPAVEPQPVGDDDRPFFEPGE